MHELFVAADEGPRRGFVIAEVAQAHDGSLGMAHAYIDAAARAGVDAIKFQTHIAAAESTLDEPFRVKFSPQDETRYAYWQRMEFTLEQWRGLRDHSEEKGLVFLSSPFSVEAVDLLAALNIKAWKIGSGETVSGDILSAILQTGKPILLSTGMSSYAEIDAHVARFRAASVPFALFQCTSRYPVDFTEVGLHVIADFKSRYDCPVGLSDHSGTVFPGLAALALGADLFEAHITFDKGMFGPDVPASLTVADFALLCEARDAFFEMFSHPVDKDEMAARMASMRGLFGKSLALAQDASAGTILTDTLLRAKKPGSGIPIAEKCNYIGRTLRRDVSAQRLLCPDDMEDVHA